MYCVLYCLVYVYCTVWCCHYSQTTTAAALDIRCRLRAGAAPSGWHWLHWAELHWLALHRSCTDVSTSLPAFVSLTSPHLATVGLTVCLSAVCACSVPSSSGVGGRPASYLPPLQLQSTTETVTGVRSQRWSRVNTWCTHTRRARTPSNGTGRRRRRGGELDVYIFAIKINHLVNH